MHLKLTVLSFALCALLHLPLAVTRHLPDGHLATAQLFNNTALPTTDVSSTQSSPLIWLGPIGLGVFALILILVIRRYSKPQRQHLAQQDIEPRDD